jgi:hypothetical protein
MIISQNSNDVYYAYTRGRFWRWDESARVWKESHLLAQKFDKAKAAEKRLTPEAFLTSDEFIPMDDYELPDQMLAALRDAKPCKNAPIEPVEEEPECAPAQNADAAVTTAENAVPTATAATPTISESGADASVSTPTTSLQNCESDSAASAGGSSAPIPSAPSFDFGADEQTNALLLQDAQTFITGNMARIMAAKHAHDLCANNKNGTWGKWCDVVGISRDTGDNMVHIAERFGNIQIEGKPIFDVQPLKLLYAVAKPSAPAELVEQVKTGDITTYKEYQELLAQIKAEKERADAAETREEEAWSMVSKAQDEAQTAKSNLEVALVDLNGLTEQNAKLQQSYHDADEGRIAARLQCQKAEGERDRAEERAKDAENQLAGSRQMAEAAKLRGDKLKAENDVLKKQPITAVVDEEEVERRANQLAHDIAEDLAAEMTADLRAQLEQAASGSEQDAHSSYDNVLLADRSFQNIGKMVVPSLRRLPPEQREQLTNMLVHTLGQIQGEVSRCL